MPKTQYDLRLASEIRRGAASIPLLFVFSLAAQAQTPDWEYPVKPGDTLYDISADYLKRRQDWRKLQAINAVANPRRLAPGTVLRIPEDLLRKSAITAELTYARGDVRIDAPDGHAIAAEAGTEVPSGSTIRTGANATASLRFKDGSRLLLVENSILVLEDLALYGKTGLVRSDLQLRAGQVETTAQPEPGRPPRFRLRTPVMSVGVRGTEFRVKTDAVMERGSTAEVLSGRVEARSAASRVDLPAGFGTVVKTAGVILPPVPLLPAPSLDAMPDRLERVPLRLKWQAQPGAAAYRVQVYEAGQPERIVLQTVSEKAEARWSDLPDNRYVLKVRAVGANGVEGHDAEKHFTLKARPEPPFLSAPGDRAKVYGERAELTWAKSEGAATYHLQVAADRAFGAPLLDATDLFDIRRLQPLSPGEYYWRVASIRADGDHGPFSDALSFTVRPIPPSPELRPPQLSEDRMSFQWPAGEVGATYRFQLARERDFASLLIDQVLTEPRIELQRPEPGSYFMRAATIDADGYVGPFSPVQEVSVPRPPLPLWLLPLLLVPFL